MSIGTLKNHRGYTVMEMMVAVVIVGVTMAVTIPAFGKLMQSNGVKSGGEQVAGHFRLARQMAVADGVPRILVWNGQDYTYSIVRDSNGDGLPNSGEPKLGPYALSEHITWKSGFGSNLSSSQLVFTPDGRASRSGTLTFQNDRGRSVTLTLIAPTGQVQVTSDPIAVETTTSKTYSF